MIITLIKAIDCDRVAVQSLGKKAIITAKIIGIQTKALSMVKGFC